MDSITRRNLESESDLARATAGHVMRRLCLYGFHCDDFPDPVDCL